MSVVLSLRRADSLHRKVGVDWAEVSRGRSTGRDVPVCLGTVGFVVVYRLVEDYLLVPRIIGRAVKVPAVVTVVAVLVGGALLGIGGALVAIPAAAALLLTAGRGTDGERALSTRQRLPSPVRAPTVLGVPVRRTR